jgi:hypothetical protein
MSKRVYLKGPAESLAPVHDEAGVQVTEFVEGWPTRQISIFGKEWITSLDDHHPLVGMTLGDQPLPEGWRPEDEDEETEFLTQEEFEQLWEEALRRRASSP